jgi:aspartate carbamoyltransferase catalytic subunit
MSFETAAKRMSADVLSFAAGSSSLRKGESLRDTVETIEAIGIDAVIIRHASSGVPARVAGWVDHCSVINAGDGWHQHPTQALLDLYTVRQALGGGDDGLARFVGLQVLIVGDIRHSRVARSQVTGYAALGAEVTLVAPATLLPPSLEGWPIAGVSHRLDDVLEKADVVSLLRVQSERGSGAFVPTLREYTAGFGLTGRRAAMLQPEAVILHPGPIVRGVEIASDVAELPASLITEQVSNGVAVRMAVLFLLLGQGPVEGAHGG